MSEKRKIDDKDLTEVTGAGDPVKGEDEVIPTPPIPKTGSGGAGPPDSDDPGGGDQDLGGH